MSSKSNVVTTTDNHANNANIQGGLAASQGDGNTFNISQLDGGAVNAAVALATHAVDTNASALDALTSKFGQWQTMSNNAAAQMLNAVQADTKSAVDQVATAYRTSSGAIDAQTVLWGVFGLIVIVGGIIVFGGHHGAK